MSGGDGSARTDGQLEVQWRFLDDLAERRAAALRRGPQGPEDPADPDLVAEALGRLERRNTELMAGLRAAAEQLRVTAAVVATAGDEQAPVLTVSGLLGQPPSRPPESPLHGRRNDPAGEVPADALMPEPVGRTTLFGRVLAQIRGTPPRPR